MLGAHKGRAAEFLQRGHSELCPSLPLWFPWLLFLSSLPFPELPQKFLSPGAGAALTLGHTWMSPALTGVGQSLVSDLLLCRQCSISCWNQSTRAAASVSWRGIRNVEHKGELCRAAEPSFGQRQSRWVSILSSNL